MKRSGEVEILFDFTRPDACPWYAIDDVVMGGGSHSGMRMESGRAVFAGVVSLDHGGGFASVRSHAALWDLRDYTGIELTLQGDGCRYKLRLKTDPGFDGVNWETAFVTSANEHQTLRFPFRDLTPVYRGKPVSVAPPFDAGRIATFGLLISDRQSGPFRLEVETVAAYR
jgi:NADH dehydrogenase [ubiquinone] 1 alpha subcomplex assembly factor 1